MKRFLPPLVFLIITAAAVSFIYKDKIFPKPAGQSVAAEGQRGGFGRRRRWGGNDPNHPVSILAEQVKATDVPVYLYGVGTVQAYNAAMVRAQVTGRLISVDFTEGLNVKKGDVLATVDPTTYQAAYDQAVAKKALDESALENAKQDLTRFETLSKSNYGSQQQTDAQQAKVVQTAAQIRQDQAAIDSAKADLDRTVIKAPIDGRTGIRDVDVGNLVNASDATGIVVITQIQPISVIFTLPETYVGELIAAKAAGSVELEASVGGKTVGDGILEVIDNRIDQNTGTVRLKGTFPNEQLTLWPGQFVNVRLHLKTLPNATVIPSVAIQQGASGQFVYLVQPDKTAKLTPVEVTQEGESQAVIAKGVQPGDQVATSGFTNLQDGSKIIIDNGQAPAETPEGEKRGRRRSRPGAGASQLHQNGKAQPVEQARAGRGGAEQTQ